MPSGAKKRKAAKKKKENQSSHPSAPTHPHEFDELNSSKTNQNMAGDEDVKHHEDRECDVGENSSPSSPDHQNLRTEGEEEEITKESLLSNLPCVEGLRIDSGEKHIEVEESVVPVDREFKIEDELDKKHGSLKCDEVARKSYDRGSSRSSSSSGSSDDESQGIKNRRAESSITSVDSVKVADSLSVESVEPIHNSPIAESGDPVVGNIPTTDSEKITVLSEQVEVDMDSPADISVAPYLVESAFKENGEKRLSSSDDKISTPVAFVDAALERKKEAIVQSDSNTSTKSDPKECVTQENDDRTTSPYNAPRASDDNGAQPVKNSVVTQPVSAPPFPIQKTSWKSCCGLFELFSRSGA